MFVEFLVVIFVLTDVIKQFKTFLDQVLANDLEDLALLQSLAGDVQRQIFGINDTFDEAEVLWDKFFTVVHNEDPSNVQLDVVALLFVLEQIERSPSWNKQQGTEL